MREVKGPREEGERVLGFITCNSRCEFQFAACGEDWDLQVIAMKSRS